MTYPNHPENDLSSDADYTNKRPPAPHSFDDLADAPDPAWLAEQNRKSSRQALWFLISIVVASLVCGLGSLLVLRQFPGPWCESGDAAWLCTTTTRSVWMGLAIFFPLLGVVGSGVIMLRKLNRYLRWRAWMGVFWALTLHFMIWAIDVLQVLYDTFFAA
ncbi:hypothetical protein G7Y31_11380 [Corynebacterium lizhenjunii]|uniref:Uncharacterized protein n=1 Tax=Corynebacterium lizhenjunii TaxID=2709394 RepID=A0A7T0KFF1_9CORY|nr:hypothetical protein [Corynebacterium lizhenjunii]QPK79074.1 hypothetical protein G7Y31_11380 [Corynebacterium lizhenjunii]